MSDEEDTESAEDPWADALNEQAASETNAGKTNAGKTSAGEAASFDELTDDALPRSDVNLDVVLDIPVNLSMEIGRTKISIRNLLQLNQGSVVELERLAGEPMDVLVNGTLIARGEVVVVNEKFGIRLTDIISPAERVKKLK